MSRHETLAEIHSLQRMRQRCELSQLMHRVLTVEQRLQAFRYRMQARRAA